MLLYGVYLLIASGMFRSSKSRFWYAKVYTPDSGLK